MPIGFIADMIYIATYGNQTKRFFTKRAAYNWLSRAMINSKPRLMCECEAAEYPNYPGYDCGIHDHRDALQKRLTRYMMFIDRNQAK